MARIFITGSADGLGQLTATALVAQRHEVVLHARNEKRGQEALDKVPGAETVLTADLGNILETKQLAAKVNALGNFDSVIHNAGIYQASGRNFYGQHVGALHSYVSHRKTATIDLPKFWHASRWKRKAREFRHQRQPRHLF